MWTPGCEYARCHCAALPGQATYLGNNKFVLVIVAAVQRLFFVARNHLVGNGPPWRS